MISLRAVTKGCNHVQSSEKLYNFSSSVPEVPEIPTAMAGSFSIEIPMDTVTTAVGMFDDIKLTSIEPDVNVTGYTQNGLFIIEGLEQNTKYTISVSSVLGKVTQCQAVLESEPKTFTACTSKIFLFRPTFEEIAAKDLCRVIIVWIYLTVFPRPMVCTKESPPL